MKKLSILFAIFAMTTTLGAVGCKKKTEEAKVDPAAKPADPAAATPTPTPAADPAAPAAPADPAAATPTAAAGDLPAECNEYKAMMEKLAACDKMPQQSRDAMKQAYDASAAAWANVPADGKAALATGCKQGADALKQAAASVCGW